MPKYKKISNLKEEDVIEILEKIWKCESNDDNVFLKIWDDFVTKFDNTTLFKRDETTKEFDDPIIKILYRKFKDFFDKKENIKNEIEQLKKALNKLKTKD